MSNIYCSDRRFQNKIVRWARARLLYNLDDEHVAHRCLAFVVESSALNGRPFETDKFELCFYKKNEKKRSLTNKRGGEQMVGHCSCACVGFDMCSHEC